MPPTTHSPLFSRSAHTPCFSVLRRALRGLEVLQACAQLLMREIGTESLASGLEVSVQVGGAGGPAWGAAGGGIAAAA